MYSRVWYDIIVMFNDLFESCTVGSSITETESNEVLLRSMEKLAEEIKLKTTNLLGVAEKALSNHEKEMNSFFSDVTLPDENIRFIQDDPARRSNMVLTDQLREHLIAKGPCQPVLEKYPINHAISERKQNCFTACWLKNNYFLEYCVDADQVFCFACRLFGHETSCSETICSKERVNRWDKMVGRGKQKMGKIDEHFTSSAHLLAAEKLLSFKEENNHIDVNLSSSKKQQASAENHFAEEMTTRVENFAR